MNELDRGWLEFYRELPGLALVFVLALLHRLSDWKVMRLGILISMAGVITMLIPENKLFITALIMIWSLGEHLVMPVRSVIAMQVAKPSREGQSLGFLSGAMNLGSVLGSILVALIFYVGANKLQIADKRLLYNFLWIFIFVLLGISMICTLSKNAPNKPSKRPKLYFHRKFSKFYALELFYGARKQVFLTFAPYVLIRIYGFNTESMALLLGVCAIVNTFAGPLVGRLTDRLGYRNIMIYDTVILFFVCLMYGFADAVFPLHIAVIVVLLNFLLDAVISTTSLATNLYVRQIATDKDELTSTLSTGISINHLIAIMFAPLGGWIWQEFGVGTLFAIAAVMAVCNSLFAMTLPKPQMSRKEIV